MATLPHDTYANPTTPLWATAQAGQQFTSPSKVVNQLIPPTAEITTIVNNDVTGSFQLNTIPNGTPLNEIRLGGVTEGISLATNGEPTFYSTSSQSGVIGDLYVTSQQTGGTWGFNNNELSYNQVKQLTGDQSFTQLGENTYTDTYGLNVWGLAGSSQTSTISDREIYFTTSTGGANTNQTYSFVSPLVPFVNTADPTRVTANPRTPLYPNDAIFYPNTAGSTLNVTGGSGTPYSVQVTNTSGGATSGIGLSIGKTDGNNLYSTNFPFWVEIEIFDPLTSQYLFYDGGLIISGNQDLLKEIKKVGGVISGIPLNSPSGAPVTFVVGDKVRAVYEWADQVNRIPRIVITKNNVTLTTTNLPFVSIVSAYEPTFFNTTSIAGGFSYTLPFNYGNTSPIIASFNDWEWTAGLGGLYGHNNTAIKPAPSGASPNATTFYSIVYLKNNCRFTSPPIILNNNVVVTISAYSGSRFGTGTLNVFVNGTSIYTTTPTASWIQGSLGTFTSTGSDTIVFEYIGAGADTLSLQRINLNYNNAVDVLNGGMGMNGTNLHIGTSNYYSFPTIAMTTSNINITKPINMGTFTISNATFNGTFNGNLSGNVNTNLIAPISPATSTQVGNLNLSNSIISNVGILATNSLTAQGLGTLSIGSPIAMTMQQNISNVGTLSSVYISNSSNISTPALNGTGAQLDIGLISPTNNFWNVNTITGRGSNFPALISMVDTINQVSAIPTGIIYIQVNFDGFKEVAIPLIPTWNRSDTLCYRLSNPNYLSTTGYSLSGKSELIIRDATTLTILEQHTNTSTTPQYFSGSAMVLNTTSILYTYRVNLNAL
jgi:hypothetical protein